MAIGHALGRRGEVEGQARGLLSMRMSKILWLNVNRKTKYKNLKI